MKKRLFYFWFTAGLGAILLAGCQTSTGQSSKEKILSSEAKTAVAATTLKEAYRGIFHVGVAVNQNQFSGRNTADAALIVKEFDAISPENVLKWESVHPRSGQFTFNQADQYVDFGTQNGMFVVGHNLVWHNQTPAWVFQNDQGGVIDRDTLLQRMHEHIATVVGRYRGRIGGWDVVNEAIADGGGLRHSRWYDIIGPEYLVNAYKFAHEADPAAELYYNDYDLEKPAKRATAVQLVLYLQGQGVHLTGIGLQSHYKLDANTPSLAAIDETIKTFAALGLKVMITELDIDALPWNPGADFNQMQTDAGPDPYRAGMTPEAQQALAKRYADVFAIYLKYRASISRVTFWGLNDSQSWLNGFPYRGRTNYPLLFDRQNEPKAAFAAVLRAPSEPGK